MVRFAGSAFPFSGLLLHETHLFAIVVTFLITGAKQRSNLKEKQILFRLAVSGSGPSKQGSSSVRMALGWQESGGAVRIEFVNRK